jgi:hypothetical protein
MDILDHKYEFLQSVGHAAGSMRPVKLTPLICPPFKLVSCAIAAEGKGVAGKELP